jgi:hypothetical protein
VTSERKIAANRRNARLSTGPRNASTKKRVRRNALRHGLAALIVQDRAIAAEVDHLATAICGRDADPMKREQALTIAQCEVALRRVRAARVDLIERMSLMAPTRDPDVSPSASTLGVISQAGLQQLLRLDRYERRALSRRSRAVRVVFAE